MALATVKSPSALNRLYANVLSVDQAVCGQTVKYSQNAFV